MPHTPRLEVTEEALRVWYDRRYALKVGDCAVRMHKRVGQTVPGQQLPPRGSESREVRVVYTYDAAVFVARFLVQTEVYLISQACEVNRRILVDEGLDSVCSEVFGYADGGPVGQSRGVGDDGEWCVVTETIPISLAGGIDGPCQSCVGNLRTGAGQGLLLPVAVECLTNNGHLVELAKALVGDGSIDKTI